MTSQNRKSHLEWNKKIVTFLLEIGLPVRVDHEHAPENSFTPFVWIERGGIIVDIENAFPGDILHEAGHTCVLPAPLRHLASGNLELVFSAVNDYLDDNIEGLSSYPEDPTCRCAMQCGDSEATAWQFAAAQAIGLPDRLLFPSHVFNGMGKDVLRSLKANAYCGINGLQAAKWTVVKSRPGREGAVYPSLNFWLHPSGAAHNRSVVL